MSHFTQWDGAGRGETRACRLKLALALDKVVSVGKKRNLKVNTCREGECVVPLVMFMKVMCMCMKGGGEDRWGVGGGVVGVDYF